MAQGVVVSSVSVITYQNVQDASIRTAVLSTKPANTKTLDVPVYKFLEITTTILPEKLKSAEIEFDVQKIWLEKNNVKPEDIVLYRHTASWAQLPTKVTFASGPVLKFKAQTPGFSIFAVGIKQEGTESTEEVEVLEVEEPKSTSEDIGQSPVSNRKMIIIVVSILAGFLVLVLIASLIIGARNKKKFPHLRN